LHKFNTPATAAALPAGYKLSALQHASSLPESFVSVADLNDPFMLVFIFYFYFYVSCFLALGQNFTTHVYI